MTLQNNRLEVYDLAYNKLCILNDNTENGAKNIEENYKLNSVDKISFVLPLGSDKWQYVLNENLVRWKNEYYFIKVPHFTHNETTKEVSVECNHLSNGLEGITCPALELIGKSASELITEVLTGTGWTVGTVDVPTDKFRALIVKEQSAFSNLAKIAELYEGILTFNSVARTVDLSDKSENRNIQIRKGKNLQSVDIEYDTNEITTILYAFGGDDPDTGLEVNIMDVNPTDKSYIENYSYYLAQGYTRAYIDAHPELFKRDMTWNATEYIDAQALYDDAVSKLNTLCKPKVKCNVEGLDLSVFPEYFIESPIIGETIYIVDDDLGLVIDAKVTEIKKQSDKPLSLRITISNEVEYNSIVKQLVDSSQKVTKVVNPNNEIRGQFIKEASIDTIQIRDGAITSAKIQDATITSAEIANATIDNANIKDATITGAKISNATIDTANIKDASITNAKIGLLAVDSANLKDASITNAKIANLAVDFGNIKDLAVGTAKIADLAVDSGKISDLAVTNAKIADATIDNAKIKDATITNAKIADATIDTAKIKDASITNAKIGNLAVDDAKIANLAVTNAKIDNLAVDSGKIANLAVTTAKIANLAVDNGKIANLAVDNAKIANLAVDNAKIADATIQGAKIANATIDNANIKDATLTNAKIVDATITGAKIANATIDGANIKSATIGTANIALGAITNALIETGAIGTAQIADGSITNAKIVELTANKITAGTLSVERLEIRGTTNSLVYAINNISGALQAQNVDTLNGETLTPRTITADKIVANAITAKEIATNTITANEIASNTIVAGNMKAGTITVESGIIGSLDVSKVTAGTMKADHIQGGTLGVGGSANGNGVITVKDENDTEISRLDKDGLNMKKGVITGQKMQLDVTNGKFILGSNDVNDTTNYKMKFDGSNLIFGGGSISWENMDTTTQQNISSYRVEVVSSKGSIFKSNSSFTTILTAYVYQGTNDITSTIDASKFIWKRTSSDSVADSVWNTSHIGYKTITVTQNDTIGRTVFECDITN